MIRDGRWTAEQDAELIRLWSANWTSTQICKQMGLYSRSQVIGRVHRLKLPKRPNPVRDYTADDIRKNTAKCMGESRKRGQAAMRLRWAKIKAGEIKKVKQTPAPVPLQVPVARVIPVKLGPVTKCRWTDCDHAPWAFCDKPTLAGRSYCEPHYRIAYQPKPQAAE